jgi:anti-sigma factor RsiW
MNIDKPTTCPDFARDFDGFLDGELEPETLRSMAFHADGCSTCGADYARAENLQSLLSSAVEERLGEIDTSALWKSIAVRLEPAPKNGAFGRARRVAHRVFSPLSTLAVWRPFPALALTGAVAALLAFWMWPAVEEPVAVEIANNHAQIERIESSAPHVAVWSEPQNHTTAIWVASYDPEGTP